MHDLLFLNKLLLAANEKSLTCFLFCIQVMAPTRMKLRVRRRDNAAAAGEEERTRESSSSRRKNTSKTTTAAAATAASPPASSASASRTVMAAEEASPDSKCPICLDRFNNLAYLDRCLHRFCFPCIQEWSHNKAECPLCKQPFASILHSVRAEDDFKEYTLRPAPANSSVTTARRRRRERGAAGEAGGGRRERGECGSGTLTRLLFLSPPSLLFLSIPTPPRTARMETSQRSGTVRRLREREMVVFRRALYRCGIRVSGVAGNQGQQQQRDITAESFRRNPAHLNRLRPWLRRELTVLYGAHISLVDIVQRFVMAQLAHYGLEDTHTIEQELRPFLSERAEHFLHELVSFARSPLSLDNYDLQATYDLQALYELSSSDSSSVIAISEGEEVGGANDDVIQTGRCLSLSGWDDETPGPSYSTAEPSCSLSFSPAPQEPTNEEGGEKRAEEGEEECLIVGYKKPIAERTPELVQLSSDTEEEKKEEEEPEKPPPLPSTAPPPYLPTIPPSTSGIFRDEPDDGEKDGEEGISVIRFCCLPTKKKTQKTVLMKVTSSSSSSRRSREDRSPSVEIIYEGTVTSDTAQPRATKRRRRRHRRPQPGSSPVIITLDSDSSHEDGNNKTCSSSSPLSSQQTVDFSDLPPLSLVHSTGVGGALDAEIGELPVDILDRGSDCSVSESKGPIAIDNSDGDVDVENVEEGGAPAVNTHDDQPIGEKASPSDRHLLATILDDLNGISAPKPNRPLNSEAGWSAEEQSQGISIPSPPPLKHPKECRVQEETRDVPPLLRQAGPVQSYNRNTPPPLKHKDAGSPRRSPADLHHDPVVPPVLAGSNPIDSRLAAEPPSDEQTIPPISTLKRHLTSVLAPSVHSTPPSFETSPLRHPELGSFHPAALHSSAEETPVPVNSHPVNSSTDFRSLNSWSKEDPAHTDSTSRNKTVGLHPLPAGSGVFSGVNDTSPPAPVSSVNSRTPSAELHSGSPESTTDLRCSASDGPKPVPESRPHPASLNSSCFAGHLNHTALPTANFTTSQSTAKPQNHVDPQFPVKLSQIHTDNHIDSAENQHNADARLDSQSSERSDGGAT
uniref:E3 ubiquitin-protein ligase Topors n=1 Tax=Amphiprion percula TaxID=161767 RepID=A0A3P8TSN7_AMPPE